MLDSDQETQRSLSNNGRETTFEWPKVVSEVSSPHFDFEGVLWGGLFSGIFRFGDRKCRFRDIAIRAFLRILCKKLQYLGNGTSDHRI